MTKENKSTEDKIIKVGLELLQTKGINGFSFADIAKIIGIKKASIHYYFPSKIDLVDKIVNQYIQNFFKELHNKDKDVIALNRCLLVYSEMFRTNLIENNALCLCSMLSLDSLFLTEDLNSMVNAFFKQNIEWLSSKFQKFKNVEESESQNLANEFFTFIQGAQILTRSFHTIDYFDHIINNEIKKIA